MPEEGTPDMAESAQPGMLLYKYGCKNSPPGPCRCSQNVPSGKLLMDSVAQRAGWIGFPGFFSFHTRPAVDL